MIFTYDSLKLKIVITGHCLHVKELCSFLEDEINIQDRAFSVDNRRDHRNTMQMNVYLMSQMLDNFENQIAKVEQNVSFSGKVYSNFLN